MHYFLRFSSVILSRLLVSGPAVVEEEEEAADDHLDDGESDVDE